MPAPRIGMRKIKDILRLRWEQGLPIRQVARSACCSPSTVVATEHRARAAGLDWRTCEPLDEAELEQRLYGRTKSATAERRPIDFRALHREKKKKGVTMALLWQEYKRDHRDGYGYSRFCELYAKWRGGLDVVMRQEHRAGEKGFSDWAGMKMPIVDPHSGEVTEASVFVMALGASSFTFAQAFCDQSLRHWLGGHIGAVEYYGGSPAIFVPDNPKTAVIRPCRYEPELHPSYKQMAEHYGAVVIPARVRRPKDKAKVENAVLQIERWVLAPLRHHTFHSVPELNRAMRPLLQALNDKPLRGLQMSRRDLFAELDRPALGPLPQKRFETPDFKLNVAVHIDHHIEFERHYYSVPFALVGRRVDVRATHSTVEILYRGKRVASHPRSYTKGRATTLDAHRPQGHRHYAKWSPERLVRWAQTVGPKTAEVVHQVMAQKRHPEEGYRSCLGILRLGKRYSPERLERACAHALQIGSVNYRSVASILKHGLDRQPLLGLEPSAKPIEHENVRGPGYYAM